MSIFGINVRLWVRTCRNESCNNPLTPRQAKYCSRECMSAHRRHRNGRRRPKVWSFLTTLIGIVLACVDIFYRIGVGFDAALIIVAIVSFLST